MNTLSWLIYVASIVNGIHNLLFIIAIGTTILIIFIYLIFIASEGQWDARSVVKSWFWVPFVFAFITVIMPTERVIYMIAASQIGEQIVTSPEGIKTLGDLKTIINQQLESIIKTDQPKQ